MKYALLFELDSIQKYLFASERLRDVAGASELLDTLTSGNDNLLDSVCKAADIAGTVEFSRRAGGAFYAFSDDRAALETLRDLWTLAVQQYAPGLAYSLGMGGGNDAAAAFDAARRALMAGSQATGINSLMCHKKLFKAWKEIEEANLKREVFAEIKTYWKAQSWWSDLPSKSVHHLKTAYNCEEKNCEGIDAHHLSRPRPTRRTGIPHHSV